MEDDLPCKGENTTETLDSLQRPPLSLRNSILAELLDKPKALEQIILAKIRGTEDDADDKSKSSICFEQMGELTAQLALKLQVDLETFGELSQMFFRFDFEGTGVLSEREAVAMFQCMLRKYHSSMAPPR